MKKIWAFGNNKYGQLTTKIPIQNFNPIPIDLDIVNVTHIDSTHVMTITINNGDGDGIYIWNKRRNRHLLQNIKVIQVACGYGHYIVLTIGSRSGKQLLFAAGDNKYGQCGRDPVNYPLLPTPLSIPFNEKIKSIRCGDYNTFIIDEKDNVWSCGLNKNGELGLGINDEYQWQLTQIPNLRAVDVVNGHICTMAITY